MFRTHQGRKIVGGGNATRIEQIGHSSVGYQRLVEREIHVHGGRGMSPRSRGNNCFTCNLAHMGNVLGAIARLGHGEEAAHMVGERLVLIARLRSAKPLQARWSVTRKHNKGYAEISASITAG